MTQGSINLIYNYQPIEKPLYAALHIQIHSIDTHRQRHTMHTQIHLMHTYIDIYHTLMERFKMALPCIFYFFTMHIIMYINLYIHILYIMHAQNYTHVSCMYRYIPIIYRYTPCIHRENTTCINCYIPSINIQIQYMDQKIDMQIHITNL